MTFLAAYIMKGRAQAMMVASSLALLSLVLPPVSIVSSASVALVTLRRGAYEGFYVLICACLSAAILGMLVFGSFQFALLYGLILWLPIWVISIVLRNGQNLTAAVTMSVYIGLLGVIGFYLYVDNPSAVWTAMLGQMVQPVINSGGDVPIEDIKRSILFYSHFMTGGIAAGTVFGLIFGLFLARIWQSALYNPGGFIAEYFSLRVTPKVAAAGLILVVIGWLMSGTVSEICWNLAIPFVALYTFAGIAILHSAFATVKTKRFMVPFLYITLILIPHMIIVVVVVGLLDAWLNLRNKFSNNTGT